jgi:hypothetical protein
MVEAGIPLHAIAQMMGHNSPRAAPPRGRGRAAVS